MARLHLFLYYIYLFKYVISIPILVCCIYVLCVNYGYLLIHLIRKAFAWSRRNIFHHIFLFLQEATKRSVFLFDPSIYTKSIKAKHRANDKSRLVDLERQLTLVQDDREEWRKAYYDQRDATGKNYWDGFKDGHKVGEQRKPKDVAKTSDWWETPEAQEYLHTLIKANLPIKLTKSQLYSLHQLAKGDGHIVFNAGFLVSIGFATLRWDDNRYIRHHYSITDYGISYLKKHPVEDYKGE